jgi:hypothetical protein
MCVSELFSGLSPLRNRSVNVMRALGARETPLPIFGCRRAPRGEHRGERSIEGSHKLGDPPRDSGPMWTRSLQAIRISTAYRIHS